MWWSFITPFPKDLKDHGKNVNERQERSKKSNSADEEQVAPKKAAEDQTKLPKDTGEQLPMRKRSVAEPKIVSQPQQQCKEVCMYQIFVSLCVKHVKFYNHNSSFTLNEG